MRIAGCLSAALSWPRLIFSYPVRALRFAIGSALPGGVQCPVMSHFDVRKAAQVVAFFIQKRGGKTDLIDAMKLAYMADRTSMDLYDVPILYDDFCHMKHGPVDTRTYDYAKGSGSEQPIWDSYIERRDNDLSLTPNALKDNFDRLSDTEVDVLERVAKKFSDIKSFDLVSWIHENCKEWEDPGRTSNWLPFERVFEVLKKNNIEERVERIQEIRNLKEELAKAQ